MVTGESCGAQQIYSTSVKRDLLDKQSEAHHHDDEGRREREDLMCYVQLFRKKGTFYLFLESHFPANAESLLTSICERVLIT